MAQYEADDSQNDMDLPALKAFMVRKMNGQTILTLECTAAPTRHTPRGRCFHTLCNKFFEPGEFRFLIEPAENLTLHFANIQNVKPSTEKINYGLTTKDGHLFHVSCLEYLIAEEIGFTHTRGCRPNVHNPVLGDYARTIFCEKRLVMDEARATEYQLPREYEYAVGQWIAVNEYENTKQYGVAYSTCKRSPAIALLGHTILNAVDESGLLFYTKEQYKELKALRLEDLPIQLHPTSLRETRLSSLFNNHGDWAEAVRNLFKYENTALEKYHQWCNSMGLPATTGTQYNKIRGVKEAVEDANEAWKTLLQYDDRLTEWALGMSRAVVISQRTRPYQQTVTGPALTQGEFECELQDPESDTDDSDKK